MTRRKNAETKFIFLTKERLVVGTKKERKIFDCLKKQNSIILSTFHFPQQYTCCFGLLASATRRYYAPVVQRLEEQCYIAPSFSIICYGKKIITYL